MKTAIFLLSISGITIFGFLNLIYKYLKPKQETITIKWLKDGGIISRIEAQGYKTYLSRNDRILERENNGYHIHYEWMKFKRVYYKTNDGTVLMKKKNK